jgi:prefoldin subunit 5
MPHDMDFLNRDLSELKHTNQKLNDEIDHLDNCHKQTQEEIRAKERECDGLKRH